MKKEYDFSSAEQGKFFRPVEKLEIPVYLDAEVKNFFAKLAIARRTRLDKVVNTTLRKEMKNIAFVAKLAESAKIPKKRADQVFSAFVDAITTSLKVGGRIAIPGFGTFSCVKRESKKSRNLHAGAETKIPARKAVKFSTSSTSNKGLNNAKRAAAKAAPKKMPAKATRKKT